MPDTRYYLFSIIPNQVVWQIMKIQSLFLKSLTVFYFANSFTLFQQKLKTRMIVEYSH